MRETLHICDLCLLDGIIRLAKGSYKGDPGWWDACPTHLKEIKTWCKEIEVYENAGDLPDKFLEI